MTRNKAIFLDRDNTIIKDVQYLNDPKRIEFLPNSIRAIKMLNKEGYVIIIITNQSAIARGYLTERALIKIHKIMLKKMESAGAKINGIYYCPHHPHDKCECRKPNTKLFRLATRDWVIDLRKSYTIGDKMSDILAGIRMGTKTALIFTDYTSEQRRMIKTGAIKPDFWGESLFDTVKWIRIDQENT